MEHFRRYWYVSISSCVGSSTIHNRAYEKALIELDAFAFCPVFKVIAGAAFFVGERRIITEQNPIARALGSANVFAICEEIGAKIQNKINAPFDMGTLVSGGCVNPLFSARARLFCLLFQVSAPRGDKVA